MKLDAKQKEELKAAKNLILEGMKKIENIKDNLEEPAEDDDDDDVPEEDDSLEDTLSEMVDALDTVDSNLSDLLA